MPVDINYWTSLHVVGHSVDGESFNVGFNFLTVGAVTDPAVLAAMCDNFWTALGSSIIALLPVGAAVDRVYARTHYNPPYISGQGSAAFPIAGTDNVDATPNNTADVISWKTKFIGRKYRGRSFWPAPTESKTAADRFTATMTTALAAIATRILTGFTGLGTTFIPAVPSRRGVFINAIQGFVIDFFIEALRDRLPRHHRHKRHATE